MSTFNPQFRLDPPAGASGLTFNDLKRPLWLHESVPDELTNRSNLRRRLGLVLQHLAAHGRTSVVKGCRGENSGWRRTPLGGNGGMQFYLWWAPQGSPPLDGVENGAGIYVRAVRHHDNHEKLSVGDTRRDYYPLSQNNIVGTDEDFTSQPWTDNQRRFVDDSSAVRVLIGRPGSGKTTALWQAIESRDNDRVLYVSWSRELVQTAKERFDSFAPMGVEVTGYDFVTLLGRICGRDIARLTYSQSRAAFARLLEKLHVGRDKLGTWADREDSLYAEMRAIMLGRAIPGELGTTYLGTDFGAGRLAWLTDAEYTELRAGSGGIGKQAAAAFVKIVDLVQRHAAQEVSAVFPELAAAAESIDLLRGNNVPEGLTDLDRVVVDEVQDLTLIELSVLVELCLAVARHRNTSPWLLLAGDEGQTVQPSGFEWARLKDLLDTRLTRPHEFVLDESVRYPPRIAHVIDNAQKLYVGLHRRERPANQRRQLSDETLEALLCYVEVADTNGAFSLLEQLKDVADLAVVTPEDAVPEWVPEHLENMVLTPSIVKGLEYQAVCVLNPGSLLQRLNSQIDERDDAPELELHSRRTAIDRLRVALSRATELLAFIDVEPDHASRELSRELLNDAATYNSNDLIEYLNNADDLPEDRVRQLVKEARQIIDDAPARAWERSVQAVQQLGEQDLPNGVVDRTVRLDVQLNLLEIAARLLVDGSPERVGRDEVVSQAAGIIDILETRRFHNAFRLLDQWTLDKSSQPFDLLDAIIALGQSGKWIEKALPPASQTLGGSLDRYSRIPEYAALYAGNVDGWLEVIGYATDTEARARDLRRVAVETLLNAKDVEQAERVLSCVKPEDLRLTGLVHEAQRRWEDALVIFEKAELREEASRVRMVGSKDYCDKGIAQLSQSDLNLAIEYFDMAIKLNPDNGYAYLNRGLAYDHRGERLLAVTDYNKAIDLNPGDVNAYRSRSSHYLNTGQHDRAIEDCTKVIDLDPIDGDTLHNRGISYANTGKYELAIRDYTEAIALNPNRADTYKGRATAYRAIGKSELARQDMDISNKLSKDERAVPRHSSFTYR